MEGKISITIGITSSIAQVMKLELNAIIHTHTMLLLVKLTHRMCVCQSAVACCSTWDDVMP